MNPTEMTFHHGQRVRFIGHPPSPFPNGLTGTIALTEGGYATRFIVTVVWDADEKGFSYGKQSVVKELLEPIVETTPAPDPTPAPTA